MTFEEMIQSVDIKLAKINAMTAAIKMHLLNNSSDAMSWYQVGRFVAELELESERLNVIILDYTIEMFNPCPKKKPVSNSETEK